MLIGSADAQICVFGCVDGLQGVAGEFAESLARCFPVCFLRMESDAYSRADITLPSGRALPVYHDLSAIEVSVFCGDLSDCRIDPPGRLHYAWLPADADPLPSEWVTLLNTRFDAVLAASPHLADIARRSGVERPITPMPMPFDTTAVAALIDPSIAAFRGATAPDPALAALAEQRLGRRADAIAGPRRQVCAAHDGGFFSVFNTYLSHLVWQQREDRCHAVLPDWDIERFLGRLEGPVAQLLLRPIRRR